MIECRGKNGWFNFHKGHAYTYPTDGTAYVSISSKQHFHDVAPIYLQGPKDEILALLGSLKAQIEGDECEHFMLRKPGEPTTEECGGGTNPELCAYCGRKIESV